MVGFWDVGLFCVCVFCLVGLVIAMVVVVGCFRGRGRKRERGRERETVNRKLRIWSLSYTLYFNLISNLSIVSIWSLTFQYCVNLVPAIIFWMKIDDMSNSQNKKVAFVDVTINLILF